MIVTRESHSPVQWPNITDHTDCWGFDLGFGGHDSLGEEPPGEDTVHDGTQTYVSLGCYSVLFGVLTALLHPREQKRRGTDSLSREFHSPH